MVSITPFCTIVDVGANTGISTLYLIPLYPLVAIESITTLPGNSKMLWEVIALNGLLDSRQAISQAIGVHSGTAVLNISLDPIVNSLRPRN